VLLGIETNALQTRGRSDRPRLCVGRVCGEIAGTLGFGQVCITVKGQRPGVKHRPQEY
jgi:hypothetical protein